MTGQWWEADNPEPDVTPCGMFNGPHWGGWAEAVAGVKEMLARRERESRPTRDKEPGR
ncbi:hypothetical protein [Kitasatospora purpeofusca]|uniref:hypothetical protein n=1 Tax=Kitasatospora purpeofusca TaxID=67352 RepID=UPI00364E4128